MKNLLRVLHHTSGWGRALIGLAACGTFAVSLSAQAVVIVVPNALATVEGNSNNIFPFGIAADESMRYQQVFDSSQFSALSGASLLTQIAFRPDSSIGNSFSTILPNVQINFSTTSAEPDGLSATFALNVGLDDTIVHSGSLALSSADTAGPGNTRAFDILINLTTPFPYNPALGNLLLDVRNFRGGRTTAFDAVNVPSDSVSRFASFRDTVGLIAQFTFTPAQAQVPEPGTLLLFGIALAGLGFSRRKRTANHFT